MVEDVSVGLVSIEALLRLKTLNYSEWFKFYAFWCFFNL